MTKQEWLKNNGFSPEGITYVVLGDSFPIKKQLKDAGFVYNSWIELWHAPTCTYELPQTCIYHKLSYDEVFLWDSARNMNFFASGGFNYLNGLKNISKTMRGRGDAANKQESSYVGVVGERLKDIEVILTNISGRDTKWGYQRIYSFKDMRENLLVWATTSAPSLHIDEKYLLSGTVKQHTNQTTFLTRCGYKLYEEQV